MKMARTKAVDIINDGKRRSDQLVTEAKEKADEIIGDAEKLFKDAQHRAGDEAGKVKAAFRAGVDAYKAEKS